MSGNGQPNADDLATVAFMTGVNPDGKLNTVNGWRWDDNIPATYNSNNGSAHKWGGGAAGTAGGTVNYCFDEGSEWTAAEEGIFRSALALWSAVANITFTEVDTPATAQVVFYRYGTDTTPPGMTLTKGSAYTIPKYDEGKPGDTTVPATQTAYISIDTDVAKWEELSSFSFNGGTGVATVVHELGHLLGLDHTGPYNGGVDPKSQQYNATDVKQWSIMSYIFPTETDAKFYDDYTVTDTNWTLGTGKEAVNYVPTTFMPDDILALQRLYGAPATTPLDDVTFGFNCTIKGDCAEFFDFDVNADPVVTLWASGLDNELDLSKWSTPAEIDLNPGTFSSADEMVNNIGIAYGTHIDTAIGGDGDDAFTVNADADTIEGGAGSNTVIFGGNYASYTATRAADGTVTVTLGSVADKLYDIAWLEFADQDVDTRDLPLPCFAAGTGLATLRGEVAVRALRPGDMLRLADGTTAPLAWLGHRALDCRRHPRPHDVLPVRVSAHAFGPDRPHTGLLLSPDHAVFADGVLIPVRYLVNGATIAQQPARRIEYWHVELPAHGVLLAQGLPVESYLDTGNRGAFANGGGPRDLHPDFARAAWTQAACAPLVTAGAELEAVRSFLLEQAEALGWQLTREPAVALEAGGARIAPTASDGTLAFALPPGTAEARLLSRCFVPAQTRPDSDDCRRLGVAATALWLDGQPLPLDSPRLGAGWLPPEPGLRWTDGAGAITLAGARILTIRPYTNGRYWLAPSSSVAARFSAYPAA